MAKKRDYILDIENQASKWNHTVLKITGPTPVRRSKVLWFCNEHPRDGKNSCSQDDLETAIEKYCRESKGENWVLADRTDIPFANDTKLWDKVDAL